MGVQSRLVSRLKQIFHKKVIAKIIQSDNQHMIIVFSCGLVKCMTLFMMCSEYWFYVLVAGVTVTGLYEKLYVCAHCGMSGQVFYI